MTRPNTPAEDALAAKLLAQGRRANAAMPEILAELRAQGRLRPMKPTLFRAPRMDDPDYVDNGWTVEAGQ